MVGHIQTSENVSHLDRALSAYNSLSMCLLHDNFAVVVGDMSCVVPVVPEVPIPVAPVALVFVVQCIVFLSFANPFHNWCCKMTKVPIFPTREALKI